MDRIFQPVGHRDQRRDILRVFASDGVGHLGIERRVDLAFDSVSSASVVTSLIRRGKANKVFMTASSDNGRSIPRNRQAAAKIEASAPSTIGVR